MSELNWHLPAAHFHRCFSTLQSLTNWWAHFSSICFSSSSEHVDTEDTEHEFPACFYSRELSLENKRKKKRVEVLHQNGRQEISDAFMCVHFSSFALYLKRKTNPAEISLTYGLTRCQVELPRVSPSAFDVSYLPLLVFFSPFFFFLHRCLGEKFVQRSPFALASCSRTLERMRCSLLLSVLNEACVLNEKICGD